MKSQSHSRVIGDSISTSQCSPSKIGFVLDFAIRIAFPVLAIFSVV